MLVSLGDLLDKKSILVFSMGFIVSALIFSVLIPLVRVYSGPTQSGKIESRIGKADRSFEIPSKELRATPLASENYVTKPLGQFAKEIVINPSQPSGISNAIETAAFKSFISKAPDAHSLIHEVKSGDTLTAISKKHKVGIDLIRIINQLKNDSLSVGQKLKISTYKLSAVVDKSQNILILKGDEQVLKTYVVATGKGNSSPIGTFKITTKLVNPIWYRPDGKVIPYGDPENLLGTRWLGVSKKGYGIHGTTEPETLGQQVTDGCVRMRNEEVEELYGFLVPGTEVTIVD